MTRGRKRKTKKLIQYYGEDFAKLVEDKKKGLAPGLDLTKVLLIINADK